jgi:hypothetical protein
MKVNYSSGHVCRIQIDKIYHHVCITKNYRFGVDM